MNVNGNVKDNFRLLIHVFEVHLMLNMSNL